jgi:hypothetical protein
MDTTACIAVFVVIQIVTLQRLVMHESIIVITGKAAALVGGMSGNCQTH